MMGHHRDPIMAAWRHESEPGRRWTGHHGNETPRPPTHADQMALIAGEKTVSQSMSLYVPLSKGTQQRQVAVLFRWAYLTAARTIKVADPDWSHPDWSHPDWSHPDWNHVDGGTAITGEDRPTVARVRLEAAQEAQAAEQYAVIETVAGWDALAGNSRRLERLRDGLEELYRMRF
jgi:hypothetical protein